MEASVGEEMKYPKSELEFNRYLVREYFKHGTVEEVFRVHRFSLPISAATYHRVLDNWGVVKTVGPNNKLNEAVDFLSNVIHDDIPLEELYKKVPLRFQTSLSSMYRILAYMKEGVTRRVGVGLVITPYNQPEKVLIANDVSTPRIELGKVYNCLTIPMGYARKRDSRKINIIRILQQEVFSEATINQTFPHALLNNEFEPFMYLDIADVRVAIYHIQLPKDISEQKQFTSYKLNNYEFLNISDIKNARAGVKEAVLGYKKFLFLLRKKLAVNPLQAQSFLNQALAEVVVEL